MNGGQKCPCCGSAMSVVEVDPLAIANILRFSRMQRKIFNLLVRDIGIALPTERVLDRMYDDDPDGGPIEANRSLLVITCRMRKKLKPFGLTIRSYGGGRGGGSLMSLERLAA